MSVFFADRATLCSNLPLSRNCYVPSVLQMIQSGMAPTSACGFPALGALDYFDCSGTSVGGDSASVSVTATFEAKNSKRFRPPALAR
jgi:hypothetical protein